MKGAQWFSHDSNARNDEKIVALRMKHGWEGYGIYWAIVEKLRESTSYRLSVNFNLLAFDLRTTNEVIKSIVTGFGLFTIEEDYFYSRSLCERMSAKDEASGRAREKALKRWGKGTPASSENDGAASPESPGNATAMPQQSPGYAKREKKRIERKDDDDARAREPSPSPPESKPEAAADPPQTEPYLSLETNKAIALADRSPNGFVETHYRAGLPPDKLDGWLEAFHRQLAYDGVSLKTQKDYRKHFAGWVKFQPYTTGRPEDFSPVKAPLPPKPQQDQTSLKTGIKML